MGLKKEERIKKINEYPANTIFVVRAPNDEFWRYDNNGYTDSIELAKTFTRKEIVERLEMNGLMDKTIEVFTPAERL